MNGFVVGIKRVDPDSKAPINICVHKIGCYESPTGTGTRRLVFPDQEYINGSEGIRAKNKYYKIQVITKC